MTNLTELTSWKELSEHYTTASGYQLRDLFNKDSERFNKFSLQAEDLLLDYSKNRITEETLNLLLKLAEQCKVKEGIENMFSGKKINITEKRAVLHTALRNRSNKPVLVDGANVM